MSASFASVLPGPRGPAGPQGAPGLDGAPGENGQATTPAATLAGAAPPTSRDAILVWPADDVILDGEQRELRISIRCDNLTTGSWRFIRYVVLVTISETGEKHLHSETQGSAVTSGGDFPSWTGSIRLPEFSIITLAAKQNKLRIDLFGPTTAALVDGCNWSVEISDLSRRADVA